jgi:hypothetical protein
MVDFPPFHSRIGVSLSSADDLALRLSYGQFPFRPAPHIEVVYRSRLRLAASLYSRLKFLPSHTSDSVMEPVEIITQRNQRTFYRIA